jgi:hypothetical protein
MRSGQCLLTQLLTQQCKKLGDYRMKPNDVYIDINEDGCASIAETNTPDYISYPTKLKVSVINGEVVVFDVNMNNEWEVVT